MLWFLVSWSVHANVADVKLHSSFVPVGCISPFLSNVELLCSRYRRMSSPFVSELISVLAFKVLRATTIVGVLTDCKSFKAVDCVTLPAPSLAIDYCSDGSASFSSSLG